jgi:hypothetical protein
MIQVLLPNLRWVCVPSETLGEDWLEKSLTLDQSLHLQGMDLAEEAVYLLFSLGPQDVLDGRGECLIARSVIGPKKALPPPFRSMDWTSTEVWKANLEGENLRQQLESLEVLRTQSSLKAQSFMVCVRRQLRPHLSVKVEALLYE